MITVAGAVPLAVDYGGVASTLAVVAGAWAVIGLGIYVWYALALSRLFPRLGEQGWKGWVPVLNEATILSLGGRPAWNVVFFFVPVLQFYGLYLKIVATHDINRRFGRGGGSTALAVLLPPVWATLLAWGAAPYPEDDRLAALQPGPRRQPQPGAPTDAAGHNYLASPILPQGAHGAAAPQPGAQGSAPAGHAGFAPAPHAGFAPAAPGTAPASHPGTAPLPQGSFAPPAVPGPPAQGQPAQSQAAPQGLPPVPLPPGAHAVTEHPPVPLPGSAAPAAAPAPVPAPAQFDGLIDAVPGVGRPMQDPAPAAAAPPAPTYSAPAPPAAPAPTAPAAPTAPYAEPVAPAPTYQAPSAPSYPAPVAPAQAEAPLPPATAAPAPAPAAAPADPFASPFGEAVPGTPAAAAPAPPAQVAPVPAETSPAASAPEALPPAPAADPFAPPQHQHGAGIGARSERPAAIRPAPIPVELPGAPAASAAAPAPVRTSGIDLALEDTVLAPRASDDDDLEATVVVPRRRGARRVLVLDDGRRFALSATSIVIGRNPEGDAGEQTLSIPDKTRTLSKTHARLIVQGDEWRLTDLHSTNGVVVVADDGAETLLDPGESVIGSGRFLLGEVGMHVALESDS